MDGYVHRRLAHALGCAILAMSISPSGPPVPLHAQTAAVCSGIGPPCPTFTKDVAAILQRACQECHRPESIGPMPLVTYADVRPWAKAVRQKVLAREMPPWFVDPRVGVRSIQERSDAHQTTRLKRSPGGWTRVLRKAILRISQRHAALLIRIPGRLAIPI